MSLPRMLALAVAFALLGLSLDMATRPLPVALADEALCTTDAECEEMFGPDTEEEDI